jgi:hypothetical protein
MLAQATALLALVSISTAALAEIVPEQECAKYKRDEKKYKKCIGYYDMAGTPSQRKNARQVLKKNRLRKQCAWYPNASSSHRIWACKDYQTDWEKGRGIH